MDEFLIRALAAGLGVALAAGPLGVMVVWRRMAYFGDSLAHSGLLGVALGVVLGIAPGIGVVAVCLGAAAALALLQRNRRLATDTILGILAHGTLALGLVILSLDATARVGLMGYLFGDILAVGWTDVAWIYGGGAVALVVLWRLWGGLVSSVVHEELARVEGVRVDAVATAFMLVLALVVALAMKIVGVLLVTALLIMPAATVRPFAGTPEAMAALAAGAGAAAVAGGLWGSVVLDAPSGPMMVVAALVLFLASLAVPSLNRRGV
jgi:zinc transport system permease protein